MEALTREGSMIFDEVGGYVGSITNIGPTFGRHMGIFGYNKW